MQTKNSTSAARFSFDTKLALYEVHRVQAIYGRRSGAQFPEGCDLEQGDWALLDQVKTRSEIYREVTS